MITSERFVLLSDTNSLQFDDDVFLKLPGGYLHVPPSGRTIQVVKFREWS